MKKLLSLTAIAFSLSMGLTSLAQAETAAPAKAASAPAKAASAPEKAASAPAKAASAPVKAAPVKNSQQNKMTTCNASAKGQKGDERKAFMKNCLKK